MGDFKGKAILVTIIQQVGGVVISIQQQAVGVRVTIHNNMGSSEKERKNQQIVFHCSHQPFATIERKAFSLFFYSLLLTSFTQWILVAMFSIVCKNQLSDQYII